jgi:hypothetical protein
MSEWKAALIAVGVIALTALAIFIASAADWWFS